MATSELGADAMPRGWRENRSDGSVACPHRDVSVCKACEAEREECVEVCGAHFWVANPKDRADLLAEIAAAKGGADGGAR